MVYAELANITPIPCTPSDSTWLEWDTVVDPDDWPESLSPPESALTIQYSDIGWSVEVHIDFQWTGTENFTVEIRLNGISVASESFVATGGTTATCNITQSFSGIVDNEDVEVVVVDNGTTDLTTLGTATVDGDFFKVTYEYRVIEGGLGSPFPLQPGDFALTLLGSVPRVDNIAFGGQVWRCVILRNGLVVGSIEAVDYLPQGQVFRYGCEFGPDGSLYIAGSAPDTGHHVYKWTKEGEFQGIVDSIFPNQVATNSSNTFTKTGIRLFMMDQGQNKDTRTASPIFGPGAIIKTTKVFEQDEDGERVDEHRFDEPAPKTLPSSNFAALFIDEEREILYGVFEDNRSVTHGGGTHGNSTYTTFKTYVARYDLANRVTLPPLYQEGPPPDPGGAITNIRTIHFVDGDVLCDGTVLATLQSTSAAFQHQTYRIAPSGQYLGSYFFQIHGAGPFLPGQAYCQDYTNTDYFYAGFNQASIAKVYIPNGSMEWIDLFNDQGDADGYYNNLGVVSIAQYADGCFPLVEVVYQGLERVDDSNTLIWGKYEDF